MTKLLKRTPKERRLLLRTVSVFVVQLLASRSASDSRKACLIKLVTSLLTYLVFTKTQPKFNGLSHHQTILDNENTHVYRLSARLEWSWNTTSAFWWYSSFSSYIFRFSFALWPPPTVYTKKCTFGKIIGQDPSGPTGTL